MPYTVSILGAGRVGSAIAIGTHRRGLIVKQIWSRNAARAKTLADKAGARPCREIAEIDFATADIIFICVKDEVISQVANSLAKNSVTATPTVIAHTSGSRDPQILAENFATNPTVHCGSLHPLGAFTDSPDEWRKFSQIFCLVDGDALALSVLKQFAAQLGSRFAVGRNVQRALYHAGCVLASNYLVVLSHAAAKAFAAAGIATDLAGQMIAGLQATTLQNLENLPVFEALTGPIVRGDAETVALHLQAMREFPRLAQLYRALGTFTLAEMAGQKNLDRAQFDKLKSVLILADSTDAIH